MSSSSSCALSDSQRRVSVHGSVLLPGPPHHGPVSLDSPELTDRRLLLDGAVKVPSNYMKLEMSMQAADLSQQLSAISSGLAELHELTRQSASDQKI
eukprot:6235800-Amphidinium_carterae.1